MNVSAQSASLSLRGSFFTAAQSMSSNRFQRRPFSAFSKNVMYSRWNLSLSARESIEELLGKGERPTKNCPSRRLRCLLRDQPVHELGEIAERLNRREVFIRHADAELLFEVRDELHHGDGVEAQLRDDGVVLKA